jgi:hypothetical protein
MQEYIGMAGFIGFEGFQFDHFAYFILRNDANAQSWSWIQSQMASFAADVLAILQPRAFYAQRYTANPNRPEPHCWAAFGPPHDAHKEVVHQSVYLSFNGLAVSVNIDFKRVTERFKDFIRDSPDTLKATFLEQHNFKPFELLVEERVELGPRRYDYRVKMRLHSSVLVDTATSKTVREAVWDAFAQTVLWLPLPGVRLDRLLTPTELLDLSTGGPTRVVQVVAEILQHNHALVAMLNA